MAIVATNLKKGQCIKYDGDMGIVLGLEHRDLQTVGNQTLRRG